MRPSASTVGVYERLTPYFLYSTEVAPSPWLIGIGYSPPARKSAVSPESAVRLGSDSVETRPMVSPMSSAPSRSSPNSRPWPASVVAPVSGVTVVPGLATRPSGLVAVIWVGSDAKPETELPMPSGRLGLLVTVGAQPVRPWPMPKRKPLEPSMLVQFMPRLRTSVRLTSANLTCRLTCSGVAIFRRLMTLVLSPTKALTSRSASAASSGAATVPVSSTVLFIVEVAIFASGMARCSIWSMLSILAPTRTLADQITAPAALLA